jgi:hypothetical protein
VEHGDSLFDGVVDLWSRREYERDEKKKKIRTTRRYVDEIVRAFGILGNLIVAGSHSASYGTIG